ncbi:MAG: acyl carrier protein [Rhodothermales bacterium]|nr:acyl carrier protein [Rhodothermales bacterium]
MADEITDRLFARIAEYAGTSPSEITIDSSFEELGVDSLDGLTIVSELEEEFDVSLPSDEVLGMTMVREAVESFQKHISLKAGQNGASDAESA